MEDRWRIGSAPESQTPSLWWRSGRYVRLRIETGAKPLVLRALRILSTGFPLKWSGKWKSSDASWDQLMPLFESAYRASGHEVWTDTPYYEQLGYVGDTLLDCITNYAWCADDRLSRRAIRLFEWSRHAGSGLIAERYPSQWRQECPTFSLLWPTMVRDFAWWRDDPAFVKEMLPGIRSVLAEIESFAQADGLLHRVPGWPWIDWVPAWSAAPLQAGCGPGVREGDSCIVNLLWVRALLASAQIEEAYGDPLLMERDWSMARRIFVRVVERYWDESRGVFRDTCGSDAASEHAQYLAILTGLLDAEKAAKCFRALREDAGLARATIGASFYLLDALYRGGEEAEFFKRLEFWRALPGMGFTSTPEGPEPSRSDAHAWGAHPAWHTLASIAGVRPDAPAFAKVRVAPMPGPLDCFDASIVHPLGLVDVAYQRTTRGERFVVRLPASVTGTFLYKGQTRALAVGVNEISIS
jgi:hypothetical protein